MQRIEYPFSFRTDKESGTKRPTVELGYDVPAIDEITEVLKTPDSKEAVLVVGVVQDIITDYIRGLVNADTEFDQAKLDALVSEGKISLTAIANLPKSERNVMSKEDLENFAKDYIAHMPKITGKTLAKVQSAAGLFVERFKKVAGDNDVLAVLQKQLETFVSSAPGEVVEAHSKVIGYLGNKLEELLQVKVTADSL